MKTVREVATKELFSKSDAEAHEMVKTGKFQYAKKTEWKELHPSPDSLKAKKAKRDAEDAEAKARIAAKKDNAKKIGKMPVTRAEQPTK